MHSDGAFFVYVKEGKLHGFVASHVDDLFMSGDDDFELKVEEELNKAFEFSKLEENNFKYCGCRITTKGRFQ